MTLIARFICSIASAPINDEQETEDERQAVAETTEWRKHN
jgi:hypothetical protein